MTRASPETPVLDWRIDVGLITEPLLLMMYLKVMVISAAIMAALLAFLAAVTGSFDAILPLLGLVGIVLVVVMLLSLFAAAIVMRNRFAMRFVVDGRGVRQLAVDRRASAASTAAVVLGAVAGSPGTAGAGLLAKAQANRSTTWSAVASVRYHPSRHAIALRNSWRTTILIFCTAADYDAVAARVAREVAAHAGGRRPRPNPLPGLIGLSLVVVLACLPFFVLPYPFELDLFAPILTLCFALTALWLVPFLGVVAIAGLAWMWVEIAARADGALRLSRPDEWAPLAITAVATVALVALIVALIRGRIGSGLAGDEEEMATDDDPKAK